MKGPLNCMSATVVGDNAVRMVVNSTSTTRSTELYIPQARTVSSTARPLYICHAAFREALRTTRGAYSALT